MKLTIGIVCWLLALPGVLRAESRLVFPKVYSVAELQTTGFAVVNPTSTNATVLFSLYLPNHGVGLVTGGRLLYQSSWTVLAKSQLSKLGSDLFPNVGGHYPTDVPVSPGWVEVTTEVTGLQGFWIGGDFATYTDGAGAAPLGTQLIFPLVAAQTEINVANVGHVPVTGPNVTFHLVGKSGRDLAQAVSRSIYAYGAYQARVSDLFGNLDFSEAMYVRVDATTTIAGTEVVRGFLVKTESAVLNAVNLVGGNVLNFVHAVSGSTGIVDYTTMVGVINLASTAQTVRISFNSEPGGNAIAVERSLPPNGVLRESAQSLLGFSSEFQNGWIQISGSSPITGFVAYADTASGSLATVPVQGTPQTSMLFDQIAGLPTWYTGIGLLNVSTTDANVEIFAMTPGGTLIGGPANVQTAAFTLPAGHKIAKLLAEFIPATASQNGGFVYVRTRNNVPLYGIELFGSNVVPILSNVTASGLVDGVTYTPPGPFEPLKLTSVSPSRAARLSTITLSGSGFGYPPSDNKVVFTAGAGTVEVAPVTASLMQLTVIVPFTATTGPIFVRTGGRDSSAMILEVVESQSRIIQNPVMVTEGEVTDNADIYVSQAAGLMKIQALGVGDVGAAKFLVAPFGVEVSRGQRKQIAVLGLGIGAVQKSKVTISGGGLTLDSAPVLNGILVTLTVDSNAEAGPRTLFVTNSNLDTLSIPGGVYIR